MLILGLQKTTLLDYPGLVASTIFTGGCNFRCPFCHNGDLVLHPDSFPHFTEEAIFIHLTEKKKILDGVCITGGEPTLQADLPDFIKKIKDMGLKVKLDTNGTNPSMIASLIENNLIDYIAMDIKQCPLKYNTIACMPHFDIDIISESVKIIMSSGIDYEFRTTVMKECHSMEDMIEIGQWLKGAKAYYLQAYRDSDTVINPIYSAPDITCMKAFATAIQKFIPNTNLRGID